MIERIIEYSVRNRAVVILLTLGVVIWGLYSIRHTAIDAIPDLSENQVIVFTDWMGRSPKEIEDQITYPLSVNLQGLAGVKTVRSSSEFNFSMINIIFDDSVDFYFARTRVQERLAIAGTYLPPGVTPYLAPDATALGQIFWYTVEGDGYDLGRLRALQDWYVRYQLNSVPGVAQVSSVGGFPKEYQVDVDPNHLRAYNITLGEIYNAISRSNAAVGGRVVHKGNAEYLVRGVGWIESLNDIRNTVVVERQGIPIRVGDIANVTEGSDFRRSVLEKDNKEAVGAVVMMRYGENPLEVTKRIEDKIRDLQSGLPDGVRIVPFYNRTPLIHSAIRTITHTLVEEMIIAAIAVLLILSHFRSALAVTIVLPISVVVSFIFMRMFNVSSNIMSLAGIAISIGLLVDQAVVMVENATHQLMRHYGKEPVTGDTTEIVVKSCRMVGRPIFFSVVIMIVSFLPVFALSGMEGKMFHPLAWTKTFALIGVSIISITFIPAIIPILVRGRLRDEQENIIVRSFINIYRPVLEYLLHKPRLVLWLFMVIIGLGVYFSRHLGREFMPSLDEGSILDMPVTAPRLSVTQAADDLKQRDNVIREFPEIVQVVGKAGRAETPTDPSPLDMVESILNLRERELWPKRKLKYDDALAETGHVLSRLEQDGAIAKNWEDGERDNFINTVAMGVMEKFDAVMRKETLRRFQDFEAELTVQLKQFVADEAMTVLDVQESWVRPPTDVERNEVRTSLDKHSFTTLPTITDVEQVAAAVMGELNERGLVKGTTENLILQEGNMEKWLGTLGEVFGYEKRDFYERTLARLREFQVEEWKKQLKIINWQIFSEGATAFARDTLEGIRKEAQAGNFWKGANRVDDNLVASLSHDFEERVYLWHKDKKDVVQELDSVVRMLGWSNIWTQPIINRIDMLATGVRTEIGVKVFGRSPEEIQQVSEEIAAVVKEVRGAVDVVADQTVGKGYVEIHVDRARAARYGVNVADVLEVIEIALGGKPITTTVEGRERFPIRVRYSRDFRVDEESIRKLLVSSGAAGASGMGTSTAPADSGGMGGAGQAMSAAGGSGAAMSGSTAAPMETSSRGSMPAGGSSGMVSPAGQDPTFDSSSSATGQPADSSKEASPVVYLGDVADVRVVEGPVMIKSENGLLRSYVQLNVRDRDIVSFVEEARRKVAEQVKLPTGSYVEWSGQFEHQVRAKKTLQVVFPAVMLLIFLILFMTYHDLADAGLMMMAVPGALAGGVMFQTLFGFNFSVAVWVGYIACFGMAAETGIVMLVYLRDAIDSRGGLASIRSLQELETAVVTGAVHRLRPKLLTEATMIVGLAPMLWATGVGAEMIRPMAAPVLGGILVADEVIDIFLPVLFYHVRARRWKKLQQTNESPADDSPDQLGELAHA